jgi:hypothetical protein
VSTAFRRGGVSDIATGVLRRTEARCGSESYRPQVSGAQDRDSHLVQ